MENSNSDIDKIWDKMILNSCYPTFGNKNFIFYEESDAQFITKEGKKLLKELEIKEFIFKRLDDIHSKIEGINIRYEHNLGPEGSSFHIIETNPLDIHYNNKIYIDMEIKLTMDTQEKYPNEDLLFVSSDSLTEIKNHEKEWKYKT